MTFAVVGRDVKTFWCIRYLDSAAFHLFSCFSDVFLLISLM